MGRGRGEEALACYTMGSAYAEFMENEQGSHTKGKFADRAILSEDFTKTPPDRIRDIQLLMTILGGRVVFE